jgi:hypothetical protein
MPNSRVRSRAARGQDDVVEVFGQVSQQELALRSGRAEAREPHGEPGRTGAAGIFRFAAHGLSNCCSSPSVITLKLR